MRRGSRRLLPALALIGALVLAPAAGAIPTASPATPSATPTATPSAVPTTTPATTPSTPPATASATTAPTVEAATVAPTPATGSISGTVRTKKFGAAAFTPVAYTQVIVRDPLTLDGVAAAWTSASGAYTATGIPPGSYLVATRGSWESDAVWYPNAAESYLASTVAVTSKKTTTAIDLTEPSTSGSISGVITAGPENWPVAGARVDLIGAGDYLEQPRLTTDANGRWSYTGHRGQYAVSFTAPDGYVWPNDWSGGSEYPGGDVAIVSGVARQYGETHLETTFGRVSGTVRSGVAAPGTGSAGRLVTLSESSDGIEPGTGAFSAETRTAADGSFSFASVPEGEYFTISVQDVSGTGKVWWGGARNSEDAQYFTVAVGRTTTGIDQFVAAPKLVALPVTIAGTAKVGRTLEVTGSAGWSSPRADRVVAQWWRDGVKIAGATGKTYTTVAADKGHVIGVTVRMTRAGYQDVTSTKVVTTKVQ